MIPKVANEKWHWKISASYLSGLMDNVIPRIHSCRNSISGFDPRRDSYQKNEELEEVL